MQKLACIIIDDEIAGRENLKFLVDTYCPDLTVVALAESAVDGKNAVKDLKPDVVFLDINMPVLDGFDFLESLSERNFMVVFVTAHNEYGIRAIRANAVDYLLKPVNIKELQRCSLRLVERKKGEGDSPQTASKKIIIPKSMGFEFLESSDIIRLEADDCYTHIYLSAGNKLTVTRTLKQFEEVLPEEYFFRVHKSHIINLNFMKEYSRLDGGYAFMEDGSKVEVSRRKAPDFLKRVKKHAQKLI
jgi:two-component system, LytTR family, response regulator